MVAKKVIFGLLALLLMSSCVALRGYDPTVEKLNLANKNLKRVPSYIKRYKGKKFHFLH